jgi:hypothetical protein
VVAVLAQYTNDGAATGGRLPDSRGQLLGAQQCLDRNGGSFVQVETARSMWMPLHLAGVI